jgi:hypothetical protein
VRHIVLVPVIVSRDRTLLEQVSDFEHEPPSRKHASPLSGRASAFVISQIAPLEHP